MVHVVKLAARVAPAGDLDQSRLTARLGWVIKPIEPGVPVGMQEPGAAAEQRLCMDCPATINTVAVLPQPKMLPRQIVVASCPMLPTAVIAAASDMAVSATFSLPWQAGSLPG